MATAFAVHVCRCGWLVQVFHHSLYQCLHQALDHHQWNITEAYSLPDQSVAGNLPHRLLEHINMQGIFYEAVVIRAARAGVGTKI